MFGRILGILTFRRAKYLEVGKDRKATGQAVILVVISSFIYGSVEAYIVAGDQTGAGRATIAHIIGRGAASFIPPFFGWILIALLLVFIARLFKGKTTVGEMLRVTGFVEVFAILAWLLALVAVIFGSASAAEYVIYIMGFPILLGYLVGISEIAGIKMWKALVAAVVAGLAGLFVQAAITDLILSMLKIPVA
jgi:hypothetical protein